MSIKEKEIEKRVASFPVARRHVVSDIIAVFFCPTEAVVIKGNQAYMAGDKINKEIPFDSPYHWTPITLEITD